jgi:VIT1/CCC1 family predicted Fe2+/Mn2+ transporter
VSCRATCRHRVGRSSARSAHPQTGNAACGGNPATLSFTSGALLPLLAILLPPAALRVPVTFAVVLVALGLAGAVSAHLGGSSIRRAVLRLVIGGALGLAFTYGIGHLFGTAIG